VIKNTLQKLFELLQKNRQMVLTFCTFNIAIHAGGFGSTPVKLIG